MSAKPSKKRPAAPASASATDEAKPDEASEREPDEAESSDAGKEAEAEESEAKKKEPEAKPSKKDGAAKSEPADEGDDGGSAEEPEPDAKPKKAIAKPRIEAGPPSSRRDDDRGLFSGGPPAIEVREVFRTYGQVMGLANVWMRVEKGIVGLLGPNGAGKSTLMKILAGLLRPSRGVALVFGQSLWDDAGTRRRLGYCPEHEGVYDELTAREFVTMMAELSGLPRPKAEKRAVEALEAMSLTDAMDRRLKGYSKGMRQRAKLAQAFVHDPDVLLLDEPLTGCDPLARAQIVARIQDLANAGKVVVVSSHVLYEIEALTKEIVLIHRGRVLAEGNIYRIRELIDRHPHRVRIDCDKPRTLAAKLTAHDHIVRITLAETFVEVETRFPDKLYDALPREILELGLDLKAISSPDNNLQAVFEYLTAWYSGSAGGSG